MPDEPTHRHASPASAATESSNLGDVLKRCVRIGIPIVLLSIMMSGYVGQMAFRSYEMSLEITVIPSEANDTGDHLAGMVQAEAAKIHKPEMVQSAVKSIQSASDAMTPPKREDLEADLAKVEAKPVPVRGRLALVTATRSPVYTKQILDGLADALKKQEDTTRRIRIGESTTVSQPQPEKEHS